MNELELQHQLFQQLVDCGSNVINYGAQTQSERESVAVIFSQLNEPFWATPSPPSQSNG